MDDIYFWLVEKFSLKADLIPPTLGPWWTPDYECEPESTAVPDVCDAYWLEQLLAEAKCLDLSQKNNRKATIWETYNLNDFVLSHSHPW